MAGSFYTVMNGDDFNPVTGAATTYTHYAGPMKVYADSGLVLEYKCIAFSVSFMPTVGTLNNGGEI